ncbi:hypothetical protein BH09PSE3_BH09PSE3_16710 [soil metagenome]
MLARTRNQNGRRGRKLSLPVQTDEKCGFLPILFKATKTGPGGNLRPFLCRDFKTTKPGHSEMLYDFQFGQDDGGSGMAAGQAAKRFAGRDTLTA